MLNDLCIVGFEIIICLGKYVFVFFENLYEGLPFFRGIILSQVDVLRCVICSWIYYFKFHWWVVGVRICYLLKLVLKFIEIFQPYHTFRDIIYRDDFIFLCWRIGWAKTIYIHFSIMLIFIKYGVFGGTFKVQETYNLLVIIKDSLVGHIIWYRRYVV